MAVGLVIALGTGSAGAAPAHAVHGHAVHGQASSPHTVHAFDWWW